MFAIDEDELKAITGRLVATAVANQVAIRRHFMGHAKSGEVIGCSDDDALSAADLEGLIHQIEEAVQGSARNCSRGKRPARNLTVIRD